MLVALTRAGDAWSEAALLGLLAEAALDSDLRTQVLASLGTLAAPALGTFATVATADGVGGTHTFRTSSPARGRYLLIWFTRLPPAGPDRFQAEVYGITVRGSAVHRGSAP